MVGAHLDTVPQAPGAEDNASGVGVMLAVAEAASVRRTRLPTVFVAFGAEEPRGPTDDDHHYGSRHYVDRTRPGDVEARPVVVVVVPRPTGSSAPNATSTTGSRVRRSATASATASRTPTPEALSSAPVPGNRVEVRTHDEVRPADVDVAERGDQVDRATRLDRHAPGHPTGTSNDYLRTSYPSASKRLSTQSTARRKAALVPCRGPISPARYRTVCQAVPTRTRRGGAASGCGWDSSARDSTQARGSATPRWEHSGGCRSATCTP